VYRPDPDYNGPDNFTVAASDDSAAGLPTDLTSATAAVDITVAAVDDAPSFVAGGDLTVTDESGAQSIGAWATALSAGPPDEAGQKLQFVIQQNSNSGLFVLPPAIDAAGKLTFTPKTNVAGTAQITLALIDDGDLTAGGVDSSDSLTFEIVVNKANVWHNARNPFDVTADGFVVAADALEVINFINGFGSQHVPTDGRATGPYYDVHLDHVVAPSDALDVINQINAGFGGAGESQAASADLAVSYVTPLAANRGDWTDLLTLLALDIAQQTGPRKNSMR
jgi:hypothetical protein